MKRDNKNNPELGSKAENQGKPEKDKGKQNMMDKTLADSYPASDPPSSIPDPSEEDSTAVPDRDDGS